MTEVEKLMAMIAQQRDVAYMQGREDALSMIRRAVAMDEPVEMVRMPPTEPPPVKRGRGRPRKNP